MTPACPPGYVVALGANAVDEYYGAPYWPAVGNKVLVEQLSHEIGGMVANAACVMGHYGMETFILDVLGNDAYTDEILHRLDAHGVRRDFVTIDERHPNAKTLIVLSENERTIFVVDSAAKRKPAIDAAAIELMARARFLYSSIKDIALLGDVDGEAFSTIRRCGAKIVLDVEGSSVTDPSAARRLGERASILLFNESGFERLRGDDARAEAAGRLLNAGVETVVVTSGARGCQVFAPGVQFEVPGIAVDVVDTTGAGDTFNASFVYGLWRGWSLPETARFANAAAARSTLAYGPRTGCVSAGEVLHFLGDPADGGGHRR